MRRGWGSCVRRVGPGRQQEHPAPPSGRAASVRRLGACNRSLRSRVQSVPSLRHDAAAGLREAERSDSGDESEGRRRRALAALCERHAPRVERLARARARRPRGRARRRRRTRSRSSACKLRQFRGEASFSTWLHRLVVNACRDVAQRQRGAPLRAARRGPPRGARRRPGPRGRGCRSCAPSSAPRSPSSRRRRPGASSSRTRFDFSLRGDLRRRRACPSARPSATPPRPQRPARRLEPSSA